MKKIVRLTERDLTRLVKRVINEDQEKLDREEIIKNLSSRLFSIREYIKDSDEDFFSTKKLDKFYKELERIIDDLYDNTIS